MAVMEKGRWTDERLDDLAGRVDKGFTEIKGEVRDLRIEMNERFNSVDERFNSFDLRFDAMQRTMIIGFASIVASVVGAVFAGLAFG
ncbi:MAG TPA: hypothetical protein VNC15_10260 [Solirubrobacterales bacterium]|jgi:hypothetical protein|nr:hypothetical protein [Solirubrobacterales bacterium]